MLLIYTILGISFSYVPIETFVKIVVVISSDIIIVDIVVAL